MILSVPVDNVPLYKEQYMSLYYILDTENYKGIESEIGNIMQAFSMVLYEQTGLSLRIYMGPTSEEISSFFENQRMQYVTEEVLWKNLGDEEKVGKILQYLEKISDSDRDELIIIDRLIWLIGWRKFN